MPDETPAGDDQGQEPDGAGDQGQEPTKSSTPAGTPGQDPEPTPAGDTGGESIDQLPEWAQSELRRARAEAAKYRTRAKEADEAADAARQAELSEAERERERANQLEQQLADIERERRADAVKAEATTVANRLGFVAPSIAARLVDDTTVEFDQAGKPTNLEQLLRDVLEETPELAATGRGTGDIINNGTPSTGADMNAILRRSVGR